MKNLIYLLILCTFFACQSESKTDATAKTDNKAATKTAPTAPKKKPATIANPNEKKASLVKWVDINDVQAAMKKDKKYVLMDVYTNWCGPCKMLDKMTFSDPEVAKIMNEKFYPVKFNGERGEEVNVNGKTFKNPNFDPNKVNRRNSMHEYTRSLGIRSYPSMLIMDENMKVVHQIRGFKKAPQMIAAMNRFLEKNS